MKKEHILVIRLSAMGDVAMTVPVIAQLAAQYPQLRITVLSKPFGRDFFEQLAPNVRFMAVDTQHEFKDWRGLNALYRRLAAKKFTAVADLHNVLRSKYLRMRFRCMGIKVKHVDKHRSERRKLLSRKSKVRPQLPSMINNYRDVFARLGYPLNGDESLIRLPETWTTPPKSDFFDTLPEGSRLIAIAPFASNKVKELPINTFILAIKMLWENRPNLRFFLFGNIVSDIKNMEEICHQLSCVQPVYKYAKSLTEEMQHLSACELMISMDSFNMHLASLVSVPVVSIWGATHPCAGFLGWKQSESNAVQIDLSCRPCSIFGNKVCRFSEPSCLTSISPMDIYMKAIQILDKRK